MTNATPVKVEAADGHQWELLATMPEHPVASLLWLPALGVAARHYQPFADALAREGVATFLHEWRGHGSSTLRAGNGSDWGYPELLQHDLPASHAAMTEGAPPIPTIIGGHSLGGQLACCLLGRSPGIADRLWLVASGAPYWRAFPRPTRYGLPLAYRFLPWLARRNGALPGRRIGFGGQEAPGVMEHWAHTALTGRYEVDGMEPAPEAGLGAIAAPVNALLFAKDWLAPESSMRFLLSKIPLPPKAVRTLDAAALGARADHFHWMKHPDVVARTLVADSGFLRTDEA